MRHIVLFLLTLGLGLPLQAAQEPTHVIISTDLATGLVNGWRAGLSDIDDGFAVGSALDQANWVVDGVTVTFGNNDLAPELVVADRLLTDIGTSVPIIPGAAVPLTDPQVAWNTGEELTSTCINQAVLFMAEQLLDHSVTLLVIGPATDVACLILNFPQRVGNIDQVIALMGRAPNESFSINGHTGLTDFNFVQDVRAGEILATTTAFEVVYMTFALTSSALVSDAQIATLEPVQTPLAEFLYQSALDWSAHWFSVFGEQGFHPWDQNTVFKLAQPQWFQCGLTGVYIQSCGSEYPYQDPACAGHGPDQPSSLDPEKAQLWLGDYAGHQVTACTAYSSEQAKQQFLGQLFQFILAPSP